MDIAVESRSGIPPGRIWPVLQADGKHILTPGLRRQAVGDIAMERAVAIRPEAHCLAVDIYPRLAHRTVEDEGRTLSLRHCKFCPVPAGTDIRKAAGTACLQGSLRFKILCHGDILQVIFPVERAGYRPVVRHGDLFPRGIVKSDGRRSGSRAGLYQTEFFSGLHFAEMEFPSFFQQDVGPYADAGIIRHGMQVFRRGRRNGRKEKTQG